MLVALCHRERSPSLDAAVRQLLGNRRCREEFLDLAASHGVLGLTLSVLVCSTGPPEAAAEGSRRVIELLRRVRRRAAMLEMKRDRVVGALSNAGIHPVLLKGAALILTTYDQPYERDLADLDVLVREERLDQSLEVLRGLGYRGPAETAEFAAYRRFHFHIHLDHSDADVVEVHWALAKADSPFRLDASEVLARSTRFERPGAPTLELPCPEHMLLHLVLQNLQEGYTRFSRCVDVDRIIAATPALDWGRLVETARRGNLGPATAVSLQLARRLLGAEVPRGVVRELRRSAVTSLHLALMRPARALFGGRRARVYIAASLHELWLLRGVRQRVRYLAQMLVVDTTSAIPKKYRLGVLGGFPKLVKLVVLQLYLYAAALVSLASRTGRDELRFWSAPREAPNR
jgi:hypothetical protein